MKYQDRDSENSFVKEAERLLSKGKITEAEAKLVYAIMPGDDMVAFRTYGRFLTESNRLTDAEAIYDRMYEIATEVKELSWAGTALAAIGGIYRIRKNYFKATKLLSDAYKLKEASHDINGMIYVSIWQGDLCMNLNKFSQAKEHYNLAYEIDSENGGGDLKLRILERLRKVAARDKDHQLSTSIEDQITKVKADFEEKQALEKLKAEARKKRLRRRKE